MRGQGQIAGDRGRARARLMLRRAIWVAAALVALWIVYLMMVTPTPSKGADSEGSAVRPDHTG